MQTTSIFASDCVGRLTETLKTVADGINVFMCIGTEKVVSDSLGPRVGEKLNSTMEKPVFVYGIGGANITAENLMYCYNFIKRLHPQSKIAVIDAGVGEKDQIGQIQVYGGGIVPGAATNKNLPQVGDVSVVGIVAERGLRDFYVSSSHKQNLVEKLAEYISQAVVAANKSN